MWNVLLDTGPLPHLPALGPDEVEGKLGKLAKVVAREEAVLVQVDQRLGRHLPVGLPLLLLYAKPGPLLLGERKRLGPPSGPRPQEKV